MAGFPDHINALQAEWRIKHCTGSSGPRPRKYCGVNGRICGLNEVLTLDRWTSKSTIDNKTENFKIHINDDVYRFIDWTLIPSNIEVIIVPVILEEYYTEEICVL